MKNKNFLAIFLTLVLAISAVSLVACDGEGDGGLAFKEENGVYVVTGYDGEDGSVVIPESYEGKSVTKIGANAFSTKKITEITIPSSIVEIGKDAFASCSKLNKATYTGTVDEWVEIKFANKDSNPAFISKNLVIGGEKVTTLALSTATKVGDYAFSGYIPLTSVDLGDNVVTVGVSAFEDCSKIDTLTLGDKVESFEYRAFGTCDSLTEVIFTPNVKTLCEESFRDCANLASIYIPASLTSIQKAAFNYDTALVSAEFEIKEGWFVTENLAAFFGEDLDPEVVENNEEVAKLLSVEGYNRGHYWKRAE